MAESAAAEVGVGTVIAATYEVTGLLGRGGMGAVWAARHLRLPGKRVAVKVLLAGAPVESEAYARFRREAEIASRLGHPNIVEVLDWNTLPSGTPYLVLEYLEGESLAARLQRGPLPAAAVLDVARQMGSALHTAHRAGVVHRDLKPENIFLCPSDSGGVVHERVKVLDFGISKIRGSQTVQTQDAVLMGTPQYMSPEQAAGKNQSIDQRTDVFALGAIVYEMLAGAPAFSGDSIAQVVFKVVYDPAPPLAERAPTASPEVIAAVERALAKDPDVRFPDVAAFIGALTGHPLRTLDRGAGASAIAGAASPSAASAANSLDATLAAARPARVTEPLVTEPTMAAFVSASPAGSSTGHPPSTMPRGEVVTATPASAAKKKTPVALAAAIGVAVVVGAMAIVLSRSPRPAPVAPSAAGPSAPRFPAAAADTQIASPVAPSPSAAPAPSPTPTEPPPPVAISPRPSRVPASLRDEALPPAVVAELDDAEALVSGNPGEAVRRARHSLYEKRSSRAFAIMTRAYCREGDLGNAKASLTSVARPDRARVLADCKAAGMDLR